MVYEQERHTAGLCLSSCEDTHADLSFSQKIPERENKNDDAKKFGVVVIS